MIKKLHGPTRKCPRRGDWVNWDDLRSDLRSGVVVAVESSTWHEEPGAWSCTLRVLEEGHVKTVHVWDPWIVMEGP